MKNERICKSVVAYFKISINLSQLTIANYRTVELLANYQASYPMGTGDKAAGAWSRQLSSTYCPQYVLMAWHMLKKRARLHGVVLS